jgi:hypothetical protein
MDLAFAMKKDTVFPNHTPKQKNGIVSPQNRATQKPNTILEYVTSMDAVLFNPIQLQ